MTIRGKIVHKILFMPQKLFKHAFSDTVLTQISAESECKTNTGNTKKFSCS